MSTVDRNTWRRLEEAHGMRGSSARAGRGESADPVQGTLFDRQDLAPAPRARRTDPETSHEAAVKARELTARHHRLILDALRRVGRPLAGEEIADALGGEIDKVQVSRRVVELVRAELVRPTDQRHVNRSGRSAVRYAIAEGGSW